MAVEAERGCGYRVVHGLYITSGPLSFTCDRLPIPTNLCSICGNFIREFQGVQSFNPKKLLGKHEEEKYKINSKCTDPLTCKACYPPEPQFIPNPDEELTVNVKHFLMWVGRSYYTKGSFMEEASVMGISKRIPANGIPDGMVVGKSWVFLAMRNIMDDNVVLVDGLRRKAHGIFMVFKAKRLEYLIWESEATPEYIKHLEGMGLTPVVIPDGDEDHAPRKKKRVPNPFALDQMIQDYLPVDYPHEDIEKFFHEEDLT